MLNELLFICTDKVTAYVQVQNKSTQWVVFYFSRKKVKLFFKDCFIYNSFCIHICYTLHPIHCLRYGVVSAAALSDAFYYTSQFTELPKEEREKESKCAFECCPVMCCTICWYHIRHVVILANGSNIKDRTLHYRFQVLVWNSSSTKWNDFCQLSVHRNPKKDNGARWRLKCHY